MYLLLFSIALGFLQPPLGRTSNRFIWQQTYSRTRHSIRSLIACSARSPPLPNDLQQYIPPTTGNPLRLNGAYATGGPRLGFTALGGILWKCGKRLVRNPSGAQGDGCYQGWTVLLMLFRRPKSVLRPLMSSSQGPSFKPPAPWFLSMSEIRRHGLDHATEQNS